MNQGILKGYVKFRLHNRGVHSNTMSVCNDLIEAVIEETLMEVYKALEVEKKISEVKCENYIVDHYNSDCVCFKCGKPESEHHD